jgi:hypothetical protein
MSDHGCLDTAQWNFVVNRVTRFCGKGRVDIPEPRRGVIGKAHYAGEIKLSSAPAGWNAER